jgi:TolA-binding protein
MDLDPIKQLQSLLDDRGKVLEKISSIQSALGSLRATALTTPESNHSPSSAAFEQAAVNSFSDDRLHGRLVQALRDMQWQIEERVRPLAQQVVELEVARLREQSCHDHTALKECLEQIDQCISTCVDRIGEYQKKHALLVTLNQRLEALGSTQEPLPGVLPGSEFDQTVKTRLEELRQSGKI